MDTWEEPTEDAIPENALMAPYCRGRCLRCAKQMPTEPQATETMPLGMQVPVFSAANRQDPLSGYPEHRAGLPPLDLSEHSPLARIVERHHADLTRQLNSPLECTLERQHGNPTRNFPALTCIEPLLTIDEGALRKTINYYFLNATVVESMVVALQHMQISVCTLRGFSGMQGLSAFRKNIISFPQELFELRQMHEFFARVTPNDLVNISCQDTASGVTRLHRARLMERTDDGFLAKFEGETSLRPVEYNQIRERISLPWKPSALRDYLP